MLPYILRTRSKFVHCQLRVFCLAENSENVAEESRNLSNLLEKFRIDFKDVIVISDAHQQAKPSSKNEFENLLSQGSML